MIELYDYQIEAIKKLKDGCILCGGVGSGKSRTSLAYYYFKECEGRLKINGKGEYSKMKTPHDLYIITTAKKRDNFEWEEECLPFGISKNRELSESNVKVTIDSWNNIKKYIDVKCSFFIFDEQRASGKGEWVKAFLKISKYNHWILLSATPGDNWLDYIPVFIANGFYRNRTEFCNNHVVFNRVCSFPKVEKYLNTEILEKRRKQILVKMDYKKKTISHTLDMLVYYNKEIFDKALKEKIDPFDPEQKPLINAGALCYTLRRICNSDKSRIDLVLSLFKEHKKIILFYNFDYELKLLRYMVEENDISYAEWNGHKHEEIPKTNEWIYLVQYTAGAEGWNCTTTNAIIFYSLNYSYKVMTQSAGRIDRVNTEYSDLYYYRFVSKSKIDRGIMTALANKKNFNERAFSSHTLHGL